MSDRPTVIIDGVTYVPAPLPPPEPVARWTSHYDNRGMWVLLCEGSPNFTKDEAAHILKTLNTLDRDGVAWGPGRPMAELPDLHNDPVLFDGHLGKFVDVRTCRANDHSKRVCWWPLPGHLPGEAPDA